MEANLTRKELYELVWSTPMSKLAARFGVSDVALHKRCRTLNIPTPGLGYWAKIAAGQKLKRKALPKNKPGVADEILFNRVRTSEGESVPQPPIVSVADTLVSPHAAVEWLRGAFPKATPDEHGRLQVGLSFSPEVSVRQSSQRRSLLILDAFFKALELRGHSVAAEPCDSQHGPERELIVRAFGQPFTLRVEEKLRQRPHVPTQEELKEKQRYSGYQVRKWDYMPDGELLIRLYRGSSYQYTGKTSWSDTKLHRLDDILGRAVLGVEQVADYMRQYREQMEEQARLRRDAERKRLRGERIDWWHHQLAEDLQRMSKDWRRSKQIAEFLDAYEATIAEAQRNEVARNWLDAARRYVGKLTPLSEPESVPKNLDPSDEFLEHAIEEHNAAAAQRDETRKSRRP